MGFEPKVKWLGQNKDNKLYKAHSLYWIEEKISQNRIANVQSNGIWDCTLYGECTPKMDINILRGTAVQLAYMDPIFQAIDFGFGGF